MHMFDDNKNAQRSEDDLFKVSDFPGRNSQTADLLHKPQQRGRRPRRRPRRESVCSSCRLQQQQQQNHQDPAASEGASGFFVF